MKLSEVVWSEDDPRALKSQYLVAPDRKLCQLWHGEYNTTPLVAGKYWYVDFKGPSKPFTSILEVVCWLENKEPAHHG